MRNARAVFGLSAGTASASSVVSRKFGEMCRDHQDGFSSPSHDLTLALSFARRGNACSNCLRLPLLTGTVDFRRGYGSLPLKKGGQEGFDPASFGQIPLYPPFSKGELDARM